MIGRRNIVIPMAVAVLLTGPCSLMAASNKGAMFRSALLPGWGQMHMGHSTRGIVFMSLDALTWAGVGLSYLEGTFNEDDYNWLAHSEAGISAGGRSRDFLDDLSDFNSSSEYNDYIHRLARYYYPDDPQAQREYYEDHARYGSDSWNWSSESAREEFADRLRDSREWYRRSLYIAAFAVVNRVVSAIDASLLDERNPGVYTSLSFPENRDFSSFRFSIGARF
ncbi:MAG: hypothetical protein GF388_08510 [Candidatus Aegiribacteria sp.]|nr:hypothetical protein [Candidatus Aegiribacteria sp.]MBD3295124.1 hypothetical protein [Candidatus Fermentibacteria bacterium]